MPNNGLSTLPYRNVSPSAPARRGLEMKRQNDVLIYPFSSEPLYVCAWPRLGLCLIVSVRERKRVKLLIE